ncbi:hypothetical protein EDB84DRAFT_1471116, partial [Lactarius hengduanensis]
MKKICRIYWRRSTRSISTVLHPHKSTAQTIMCNLKLPELRQSCSRTPSEGRLQPMIDLVMLPPPPSLKIGTTAHRHKRTVSEASPRHPITTAEKFQTYIVPRTLSSRARLGPVAQSLIHSLRPSYPLCPLQREARTKYPQAFRPFNTPYLICATIINTATRRCTIPQGGIPGRPRCRHHRRHQECFLPLRTDGSVLLPVTRSILAPLPPRQFTRDNELPIFSGTPTPAVRRILVLPLRPS